MYPAYTKARTILPHGSLENEVRLKNTIVSERAALAVERAAHAGARDELTKKDHDLSAANATTEWERHVFENERSLLRGEMTDGINHLADKTESSIKRMAARTDSGVYILRSGLMAAAGQRSANHTVIQAELQSLLPMRRRTQTTVDQLSAAHDKLDKIQDSVVDTQHSNVTLREAFADVCEQSKTTNDILNTSTEMIRNDQGLMHKEISSRTEEGFGQTRKAIADAALDLQQGQADLMGKQDKLEVAVSGLHASMTEGAQATDERIDYVTSGVTKRFRAVHYGQQKMQQELSNSMSNTKSGIESIRKLAHATSLGVDRRFRNIQEGQEHLQQGQHDMQHELSTSMNNTQDSVESIKELAHATSLGVDRRFGHIQQGQEHLQQGQHDMQHQLSTFMNNNQDSVKSIKKLASDTALGVDRRFGHIQQVQAHLQQGQRDMQKEFGSFSNNIALVPEKLKEIAGAVSRSRRKQEEAEKRNLISMQNVFRVTSENTAHVRGDIAVLQDCVETQNTVFRSHLDRQIEELKRYFDSELDAHLALQRAKNMEVAFTEVTRSRDEIQKELTVLREERQNYLNLTQMYSTTFEDTPRQLALLAQVCIEKRGNEKIIATEVRRMSKLLPELHAAQKGFDEKVVGLGDILGNKLDVVNTNTGHGLAALNEDLGRKFSATESNINNHFTGLAALNEDLGRKFSATESNINNHFTGLHENLADKTTAFSSSLEGIQHGLRATTSSVDDRLSALDTTLGGLSAGFTNTVTERSAEFGDSLRAIREGVQTMETTIGGGFVAVNAGINSLKRNRSQIGDLEDTRRRNNRPRTTVTPTVDYGNLVNIVAWDGSNELSFGDLHADVKTALLEWVDKNELGTDIFASARNRKKSCAYNKRSDACMVTDGDHRVACSRCLGGKSFCLRRKGQNDATLSIFALHPRERVGCGPDEVAFWKLPANQQRRMAKGLFNKKLYD